MNIVYLRCFHEGEDDDSGLKSLMDDGKLNVRTVVIPTPDVLHDFLLIEDFKHCDILILGAHGDKSKSGFCVRTETEGVRWHDFAALIRGALPRSCSLIFYSCWGGYPGIGRALTASCGPDFIFGPRIEVLAIAMDHAVESIIRFKSDHGVTTASALALVKRVNDWAAETYPEKSDEYDQSFLRAIWKEGHKILRYPSDPNVWPQDRPVGERFPLRGWRR